MPKGVYIRAPRIRDVSVEAPPRLVQEMVRKMSVSTTCVVCARALPLSTQMEAQDMLVMVVSNPTLDQIVDIAERLFAEDVQEEFTLDDEPEQERVEYVVT